MLCAQPVSAAAAVLVAGSLAVWVIPPWLLVVVSDQPVLGVPGRRSFVTSSSSPISRSTRVRSDAAGTSA